MVTTEPDIIEYDAGDSDHFGFFDSDDAMTPVSSALEEKAIHDDCVLVRGVPDSTIQPHIDPFLYHLIKGSGHGFRHWHNHRESEAQYSPNVPSVVNNSILAIIRPGPAIPHNHCDDDRRANLVARWSAVLNSLTDLQQIKDRLRDALVAITPDDMASLFFAVRNPRITPQRLVAIKNAIDSFPVLDWEQWNDFFVIRDELYGDPEFADLKEFWDQLDNSIVSGSKRVALKVHDVLLVANPSTIHAGDKLPYGTYIALNQLMNRYFPLSENGLALLGDEAGSSEPR